MVIQIVGENIDDEFSFNFYKKKIGKTSLQFCNMDIIFCNTAYFLNPNYGHA